MQATDSQNPTQNGPGCGLDWRMLTALVLVSWSAPLVSFVPPTACSGDNFLSPRAKYSGMVCTEQQSTASVDRTGYSPPNRTNKQRTVVLVTESASSSTAGLACMHQEGHQTT